MIDSLTTIINNSWITYRGCLIEKQFEGFHRNGKHFDTLEAAKDDIDKGLLNLQKSISNASRKTNETPPTVR